MTFDGENHQPKPKRKKWPWVAGGVVAVAVVAAVASSGGGETENAEQTPPPAPTQPELVAPPAPPKAPEEPEPVTTPTIGTVPLPSEQDGEHEVVFEAVVGERANVQYGAGFDQNHSRVLDAGETVTDTLHVDDLGWVNLSVSPVTSNLYGDDNSYCKITVDGVVVSEQENPWGVYCSASQY